LQLEVRVRLEVMGLPPVGQEPACRSGSAAEAETTTTARTASKLLVCKIFRFLSPPHPT